MLRIAVIVGSTRPGRKADSVAAWAHRLASARGDAEYELVDIADFGLPLLDEPVPPAMARRRYAKAHSDGWSRKIDSFDGYLFVTPEYNHGVPGALKNAIDFLYPEWNDKAAGFVAYGSAGGVRSVEALRLVMGELQVAAVRAQVMLSLRDDFEDYAAFKPRPFQEKALKETLDQLLRWSGALKSLRA